MTAEEFYHLPEPEHGGKMELVRGKVVVDMPVSGKHGERQGIIFTAFFSFLSPTRLGRAAVETGFIVQRSPFTVLAPDVSVTPLDRLPNGELPEDGFVEGPPGLAVEVVSPGDSEARVMAKVGEYLDAGVDRVWLVQARTRTVTVFRADGVIQQLTAGETLTSEHAGFAEKGFELRVDDIFR